MPAIFHSGHSLKTRILVVTLVVFVITLWTLSFLASQMLRKDMEQQLGEQQMSTVSLVAASVASELDLRFALLERVAAMAGPSMHSDAALQKFLESRPELRSLFNGGLIVYRPNFVAAADFPMIGRVGVSYADRDSVVAAIRDGKSSVGRPAVGKRLHTPSFLLTVPVRDVQGSIAGALSGVVNLGERNFLDHITESHYGKSGGYLIVAARHRLIVTATDKRRTMEESPRFGRNPAIDRFHDGDEGTAVYTNPLGVEVMTSVKHIPVAGWYVAAVLPISEAFSSIHNMQKRMLLVTILMTLFVGGAMWWILRRELLPLVVTANALEELSANEERLQPLPVSGDDEIGRLIRCFNRLLEALGRREEALHVTKNQYQELFDDIPVGYHEYDSEGRITRVNKTELNMLGYAESEFVGVHAWNFVQDSERSRERILNKLAGVATPGNSFELCYRRKDGTTVPAIVQDKLRCDAHGKITGYRSIVMYIIERKQAEEALWVSEERYRKTFQNSMDSICINRLSDGVYLEVNQSFLKIFGFERNEVIGRSTRDLAIWANPDDREQLLDILRRESNCTNFEVELKTKNDDSVWGLMSAAVMDLRAEPCVISITRDITDIRANRKELERYKLHLEQLVEQRTADLQSAHKQLRDTQFAMDGVGIGIEWIDRQTGRLLYANKAAAKMIGYEVDELLEMSIPDIDPNFPPEMFSKRSELILQQGQMHFETTHRAKDGHLVPVDVILYYQPADGSMPARQIAFLSDITARKEAERSLVAAKEAAEAANVAKSRFLANMSHEIRTPLNGIVGMTHILRRGAVTREQAERLEKIDTAADHLLSTINDILDLSKIEAGKIELEHAPFAIDNLLTEVRSIMGVRAQAKGVHLQVDIELFGYKVLGDVTRLRQALLNYVTNAIKFTEQGSIVLRTRVIDESDDSVLVRFEVQDTGIGIDAEVLPRLFSPFEQADNSTSRKYGGTGLGLAITRRLSELMGGGAGAESTLGVGSIFWFTARLDKDHSPRLHVPVTPTHAEYLIFERHHGRRVLLVDDESVNLEVAQYMLEDVGLVVDTAADGLQAIARARETNYAVILMDMQMPNLDGVKATVQIRQIPECRRVPIVAMTANAFAEDKARCLAGGMNDFIAKPFSPDLLYSTLLKWLEQKTAS